VIGDRVGRWQVGIQLRHQRRGDRGIFRSQCPGIAFLPDPRFSSQSAQACQCE
jgi:hypothetical protein